MGLSAAALPQVIGRYALYREIASGGMATVHYGRLLGPVGFSRTVAIKRLHAQFAKDPEFVSMFLDEARLAARIRHPNVVQTLDVVALEGELFLVMDYVQGESLARLLKTARAAAQSVPLPIVSAILCGALHGLHAAHEATNERGEALGIVHRDVSPQNVLVGADGVPRVLDFGVAKATGRVQTTRDGQVKGKLAYMSPEQLRSEVVDRRTDVYAAGALLWEALTLTRLFGRANEGAIVAAVLQQAVAPPSAVAPHVPKALDEIVMRALDRDPEKRFATTREMGLALEVCVTPASATRLSEWIESLAGDALSQRATVLAQIEHESGSFPVAAALPSVPQALRATVPSASRLPIAADEDVAASQVSSISMSTSSVRRLVPSKDRQWGPYALIVGATAALGLGALAFVHSGQDGGPGVASAAFANVARAQRPSPQPLAPDPAPTMATSSVATALSKAPSASPQGATPTPRPAAARPPQSPVPSRSTATNAPAKPCTISSFVDETGLTHFVKDCK